MMGPKPEAISAAPPTYRPFKYSQRPKVPVPVAAQRAEANLENLGVTQFQAALFTGGRDRH
jgi:hypothetical protein